MKRKPQELSRRNFFRGAAQASVAGILGTATVPGEAEAYAPGGDETRARYRLTDHVSAFYATNGYETKNKK